MVRSTLRLVAAVALVAATLSLIAFLAPDYLRQGDGLLMVVALSLAASAAALTASLLALARTGSLDAEVKRIARSIDQGLVEFRARTDHSASTVEALSAAVALEMRTLSQELREASRNSPDRTPEQRGETIVPEGGNVVHHPTARRLRQPGAFNIDKPATTVELVTACRAAIERGAPQISLQPVIAVTSGTAAAFQLFAHLILEDGRFVDMPRPPDELPRVERATFERMLVQTAAETARRRIGDAKLYVPVSGALLDEPEELARVLDLFELYPPLSTSMLLCLPVSIASGRDRPAFERLAARKVQIVVEGWAGTRGSAGLTVKRGAVTLISSAALLLGRQAPGNFGAAPAEMVEEAAKLGLALVASGVANDEDAVGLLDLGIDLMMGTRFSEPRLLRPEDDAGQGPRSATPLA